MAEGEDREGRRHPQNLEGVLRFCIENTKNEDAQEPNTLTEMSEERRKWLSQAVASLGEGAADPVKHMVDCIRVLSAPDTESDIDAKETALDDLNMLVEDLDLANDFHKVGGFALLPALLRHPDSVIRTGGAELIAHLTQNNPYCQDALLDRDMLPQLLRQLDSPEEEDLVRVKVLYAVSCFVRTHTPSQEAFVTHDGFSVLMRVMQSSIEKLQIKAAFLLCALCEEEPKAKDTLCDMGMVQQLIGMLQAEHSSFHEYLVRALLVLATDHQRAEQECRRAELELAAILRQKVESLEGQEEYQEEVEYCKQLHTLCFRGEPVSGSQPHSVDR